MSYFTTKMVIYSDMIMIDNGLGPSPIVGLEDDVVWSKMNNITIWGETEARDCLTQNFCKKNKLDPLCTDRIGLMLPHIANGGKDPMPTSKTSLPMHKNKKPSSFGGNILAQNMNFRNFKSGTTWCGND